ncbi:immunoglobulin-like and fibronectin type III domain-containing protein 1 [Pelodiscus sinensis]|uniref:immunoglobulin-like and fibronectin type III domain-containing protein 1 n=1 Tax=Pelodiscus sinensis TaxID=13735 RepID=UPI003F6D7E19
MESHRAGKPRKKSAVPGVTIQQFIDVVPKGCSTPDFVRKPVTITLQEGKNATFRAVVTGEPAPAVIWKCSKGELRDPDKYQTSFHAATNEHVLQINTLTAGDTGLYHCSAANQYGEAACTAGLKVIQASFKRKARPLPAEPPEDLKKELQDFRKMLRKRTPLQKKEVDMDQVWQLLLNADRKDYENICLKHGIVDFRGMLRKLQQMKKDREDKQQQYIYSVTNLKHIKANREGSATFHLEIDLKNPRSRIYLYKDGQMINYGVNEDTAKHCLRQAGNKYSFTVAQLQPGDAGVYQIKVEDVDVFSTELDADSIPVGFRHPLRGARCREQGNAAFECSLHAPCSHAVWLYRQRPIEGSDKYEISISPDGLAHRLAIRNVQLADEGPYTLDIGICSSSTWLEVESAGGKRTQDEGAGTDQTAWQADEAGAKKLGQREHHFKSTGTGKDGQSGSSRDGSRELDGSSVDADWGFGSLGKAGLTGQVGEGGRRGKDPFSAAGTGGDSVADGNKFGGLASEEDGLGGKIHGQSLKLDGAGRAGAVVEGDQHAFHGKDSMVGAAASGGGLEGRGGLRSLDGRGSTLGGPGLGGPGDGGSLPGMEGGAGFGGAVGTASLHDKDGPPGRAGGSGSSLGDKGDVGSLYGNDALRGGAGAGIERDGAGGSGALGSSGAILWAADGVGAGSGGAGGTCSPWGKDSMIRAAGGSGPGLGGAGGKSGMAGGAGAGLSDLAGLHGAGGKSGVVGGAGGSGTVGGDVGGMDSLSGKDNKRGGPGGSGLGRGDTWGKSGMAGGAGAGLSDVPGLGGAGGKSGMAGGAGAGLSDLSGLSGAGGKSGTAGGAGAGLSDVPGLGGAGGKSGMAGGAGAGLSDVPGLGGAGDKSGAAGGAGAGLSDLSGLGGAGGKSGMAGGVGAGLSDLSGLGGAGGKSGMAGGAGAGLWDLSGLGGAGGKTGMAGGAGAGLSDLSGLGGAGGKSGTAGGAGAGLSDLSGLGGAGGKSGMAGGVGAGLSDLSGLGGAGGKSGMAGGAGAGLSDLSGLGSPASLPSQDALRGGARAGIERDGARGSGALGSRGAILGAADGGGPGLVGLGSLSSKDDMKGGASAGSAGAGGMGSVCDQEGMLAGAGAAGAGRADACGKGTVIGAVKAAGDEAVIGGASAGAGGTGGTRSPHGRSGVVDGAGAGTDAGGDGLGGRPGAMGSVYGRLGGAGAGGFGAGGMVSLGGEDGMRGASLGGSGGEGSLRAKDGRLEAAGPGTGGAGRMSAFSGTGPILGGHGLGGAGAGLAGAGGMGSLPGRAGARGGQDGTGGGDAALGGADTGRAGGGAGLGGACSHCSKEGTRGEAGGAAAGGRGAPAGQGSALSAASAGSADAGGRGLLSGKHNGASGAESGPGARLSDAGGMEPFYGKGGRFGGTSAAGAGGLDASELGGAGSGMGGEFIGAWDVGSLGDGDSLPGGAAVRGCKGDLGALGSLYDREPALSGAAVGAEGKLHGSAIDGRTPRVHGGEPLSYDQVSGQPGGGQADARRGQMSSHDASHEENLPTRSQKRKGRFLRDEARESRCHLDKGLSEVSAQKGEPALPPSSLADDRAEGIWLRDERKPTGPEEVSSEKEDLVHKWSTGKDSLAGKCKFEAEGEKTEASIFVEDSPTVDKALLGKLMKEPLVVKAGQNATVKIPFEGRKPVSAGWLKDGAELLADARVHIDKGDNFTRLFISSTRRMDCGDYSVKLKNESGALEASVRLEVIDKPQKPRGPIEVVDSSTTGITIRWKPPKDDGGKPVQNYIIERQQVGRKTWVTLGETSRNSSTFTTNKVERDKSYCFRVRAVNAEGTSESLESDEVMASAKAFPGLPAPPMIVSASKESIKLSWTTPPKTGNSKILGYVVEKRKKGSSIWTPITDLPIAGRQWVVAGLQAGLQYEFRVAAVNAAGAGEASAPSDAVFARDPMKPPGRVRDLRVTSTDDTSITLAWMKPDSEAGGSATGYQVEKRSSDSLKWAQCTAAPVERTSYTIRGLRARETYCLRVRAVNEGGLGEAVALDTCIRTGPPAVSPKFLRDDTMKNFMIVKVGGCIRVHAPFEASPTPEVIWLKDRLPLPSRAVVSTRDGLSQLLIPSAGFSDSGLYTIVLQNDQGKKESFCFQVQVADIPQPPGLVRLQENVLNTVTVMWDPSPTEKWEQNLYYTVLKSDSSKGSWQVVRDLIYTTKCTVTNLLPGRAYYFRVVAKNGMGTSDPSGTAQPWIVRKEKEEFQVRLPKYRRVNRNMPPRFLVRLKPHVVTTAADCYMSCAVGGYPKPKVTWYKDGRNLSRDPAFFSTDACGVCCLVIPAVTKRDEGEYEAEASNAVGRVASKARLLIKDPSI